jgi:transposase
LTCSKRELTYYQEQLKLLRAKLFGRSSEKRFPEVSPNQLLLFSQVTTENEIGKDSPREEIRYTRRKRVEGKLPEGTRFPEHLPREETIIDDGDKHGAVILEKVTERLAARETPFYVKRIVRRVRKNSDGELKTPELPPAVIEGTTTDISFLVYTIIAKYMWHLPLYRQERMLKAQGIVISRDTLIRYVLSVASLLKPIYVALGTELFEGTHLFGDETPVLVGKGRNSEKQYGRSYFWTFLGEAGVCFYHSTTRSVSAVEPLLKTYNGYLQSDGYRVYETLSERYPDITLVGCWAHVRRKFVEAEEGGDSSHAKEALRYIRVLYRIEERIREKSLSPPEILRLRGRHSRKVIALFRRFLDERAANPTMLPKSLFGAAIRYALNRFYTLERYLEVAELQIDSNAVEREIRPVALGRKNWLFCASEAGADASALFYSIIGSCKLAGVDPAQYLTDVLERISEHPASRVSELIPANWKNLPR